MYFKALILLVSVSFFSSCSTVEKNTTLPRGQLFNEIKELIHSVSGDLTTDDTKSDPGKFNRFVDNVITKKWVADRTNFIVLTYNVLLKNMLRDDFTYMIKNPDYDLKSLLMDNKYKELSYKKESDSLADWGPYYIDLETKEFAGRKFNGHRGIERYRVILKETVVMELYRFF